MPFNNEQIIALENLYEELGNADNLTEHQEQLDFLSLEDKKKVAIKLVRQCPEKNLNNLGLTIKALRAPAASADHNESFHHIATQVWTIRKKIIALQDPLHPEPHTLLLEPEFNADLFTEFNDFSLALLDGNELAIAQKLAIIIPKEQRSELVRNIQNAFPDSQFVTVVSATFAFRRELDLLLGEEPYKFFISPEFNAKSFAQYSKLLELIDDKDEEIAAKLENTPNIKRATVLVNMEALFPNRSLLEKTKELFKTPAKETVHGNSIFPPAAPQKLEKLAAQSQASASL